MKVLVVDDSNFSQKITSNLIKKHFQDAEIHIAGDGLEGFEVYKNVAPDYVFVDLLMPKLNGEGLIKLIKEYDKNAKIVVISADVQKSVREEIEKYDILSFINKPFNEEKAQVLFEVIRKEMV